MTVDSSADPRPWFETAVIYELDVETFQDGNGDGVGDFNGLTSRLPYLASLGVTALWVQPFYPSPRRDHGYDVAEYRDVDSRFGTLDDFDRFVREAHALGLRVLIDVPFNHTSDEHPWFRSAREDPTGPYRDFYVWADTPPDPDDPFVVFPGPQKSNWARDDVSGRFYFHTFYDFMPDLNIANEAVCDEIEQVMRFWMRRGIDGFRLDAVPFIILDRSHAEHLEEPHDLLKRLRRAVEEINPDGVLLAEADKKPTEMRPFFGDGDEMNLLLNFYLNNHLYLGLADGSAEPIARAWRELPDIPARTNWANFLRNHDELSLAQLEEGERERVFAAFAPEERMRAYGRGVRRRLAPMLSGDARRVRLLYSLLFSLPGTPVIFYGDEIGLGERLDLPERDAVRTPMQWTDAPGAGFTDAEPVRPFPDAPYSPPELNVQAQDADEASLLSFVRRLVHLYRAHPACGRGEWTELQSGDPAVLAHAVRHGEDVVYAVHNLCGDEREVRLPVPEDTRVVLIDPQSELTDGQARLAAYGFVWLTQGAMT